MGFGEDALQSLPGKIGSQVLVSMNLGSQYISLLFREFPFYCFHDDRFFSECHWIKYFIYFLCIFSQDVNDVLTAIDHIIDKGLASPSKVAVLGGSHGGFLTTHLIGQVE